MTRIADAERADQREAAQRAWEETRPHAHRDRPHAVHRVLRRVGDAEPAVERDEDADDEADAVARAPTRCCCGSGRR